MYGFVKDVRLLSGLKSEGVDEKFDWIIACYTETSIGLKLDISITDG